MSGSRKERLNLLFHVRVLGRSDQEAMIRDYCSSLDAAWEGVQAFLSAFGECPWFGDEGEEGDPDFPPPHTCLHPKFHEGLWHPGNIDSFGLQIGAYGHLAYATSNDDDLEDMEIFVDDSPVRKTNCASVSHPAEAIVIACLWAVGCTEEEMK